MTLGFFLVRLNQAEVTGMSADYARILREVGERNE